MERKSGVFLSISSLPSKDGIGTLGKEAYKFIDFLKESGFSYWQILPFNPTGFGNSPYQSFSTYAGNPYFIDLEVLVEKGLLPKSSLKNYVYEKNEFVNYGLLYIEKFKILRQSYKKSFSKLGIDFNSFCLDNKYWLDDYSLFMAIKDHFNGCDFLNWPEKLKKRDKIEIEKYKNLLSEDINFYKFVQYLFYDQLINLVNYSKSKGIDLICDLPIYVSMDSSDVWANIDLFMFNSDYTPKLVAGVPPDYFSETGQLWGNPLYNYKKMEQDNYAWWVNRVKHLSKYCKYIRMDHFRGFEAFYAIKYGETTAINGKWIKGPNKELFDVIKENCPDLHIIAEDLGIITRPVRKLMNECNFPGMKVLQFAFDGSKNNAYLPKKHTSNSVCYIGTHDNQTLKGFVDSLDDEQKEYIKHCFKYKEKTIEDLLIKALFKSKSDLAIINVSDMLLKDDNYRMNSPSTLKDTNWGFRLVDFKDLFKLKNKYKKLNIKYERSN